MNLYISDKSIVKDDGDYPLFFVGDSLMLFIFLRKCAITSFAEDDVLHLALGNTRRSEILAEATEFELKDNGSIYMSFNLDTVGLWELFQNRQNVDSLTLALELTRDGSTTVLAQSPCVVRKSLISGATSESAKSLETTPYINLQAYDSKGDAIEGETVTIKAKKINNVPTLELK